MRVPRVFLPGARAATTIEAGPETFKHIITVLRRGEGDPVVVLDGTGGIFDGSIASVDRAGGRLLIEVGRYRNEPGMPIAPLVAAVAIPRGEGMDLAIRFASETGLSRVQPLITARTVARPRADSSKVKRWHRLALESAEQCQRDRPIDIDKPMPWAPFLEHCTSREIQGWMALPGGPWPEESGILEALRARQGAETGAENAAELVVTIGPEGGFTASEAEEAGAHGFKPLGFPTPVLRTPTAVVYLGALVSLVHEKKSPEDPGTATIRP